MQKIKRALIPIGAGGFAVCLPVKWVRKLSLKARDKVVVEWIENDDSLVIRGVTK